LSSGRRGELWWGADWLLVLVMVVVVLLLLLPPPWPPPPPLLRLLLLWLLLLLLLAGVAGELSWAQLMNSRRARRRASPLQLFSVGLSLTFLFLPAFLPRLSDDGCAPRCAVLAGGSTPVARVASRFDTTVRRASRSPSAERPS
jgi:hypothetical protein